MTVELFSCSFLTAFCLSSLFLSFFPPLSPMIVSYYFPNNSLSALLRIYRSEKLIRKVLQES